MSLELQGIIKKIGKTQTFGSNGFAKRELVLTTTDGNYEQHVLLEFHQDNVDYLDKHKVGEEVKCIINVRGKEWINPQGEAKYFNSLVVWKIESVTAQPQQSQQAPTLPPEDDSDQLPY